MTKLEDIINMWRVHPHVKSKVPPSSLVLPKPRVFRVESINTDINHNLKIMLRNKLIYISYPSLCDNLECTINLLSLTKDDDQTIFFEETVEKILFMDNFNLYDVIKNYKTYSITFKNTSAMKLLNIIFKDHKNHVLYPIYHKWINGWFKGDDLYKLI